MDKTGTKIIAFLLLLPAFLAACRTTWVNLAPEDQAPILTADSVVVRTVDGSELTLTKAKAQEGRIVGVMKNGEKTEIAFSSIESVLVKKTEASPAMLFILDLLVATGLGIGIATAPSPPGSCPLIYAYDGEAFVLEAEPYGGAFLKGLQRSEWIGLDHLKEVGGIYRIRASNQLIETEYLDELKLIVVDHPAGMRALPDAAGRVHVIGHSVPPMGAVAKGGLDVCAALARNDREFWEPAYPEANVLPRAALESSGPALSPEEIAQSVSLESLRDEIVLEFPKPEGAGTATLIANAWTTLWGAEVAKDFLSLRGRDLARWTAAVDAHGPEYEEIMRWFLTEQLYMLNVEVETGSGWKPRAMILGGGPVIARDKAYLLNIADAKGDTLRLRLRPPAGFWRFNSFAVDYSAATPPVDMMEISPVQARDAAGNDVREMLSANDGRYVVMPKEGDYAEVLFPTPSASRGGARSMILKASGYYDPRLSPGGEPRLDQLRKIQTVPGATLRFAFAEHLKRRIKPDPVQASEPSRR